MLDLLSTGSWRGAVLESEQAPMAAASNDSGSAGQACTGVDDLHTLDEEPQCQPDFSDEAHGEPGVGDRRVGRQQQSLKEPDQDTDSVKHQKDTQEPGKKRGLVDQI